MCQAGTHTQTQIVLHIPQYLHIAHRVHSENRSPLVFLTATKGNLFFTAYVHHYSCLWSHDAFMHNVSF